MIGANLNNKQCNVIDFVCENICMFRVRLDDL